MGSMVKEAVVARVTNRGKPSVLSTPTRQEIRQREQLPLIAVDGIVKKSGVHFPSAIRMHIESIPRTESHTDVVQIRSTSAVI